MREHWLWGGLSVCIILLGTALAISGLKVVLADDPVVPASTEAVPTEPVLPPPPTIRLSFVGDLLMHTAMRKAGYNPADGTYDFNHFFAGVKKYFEGRDFVIGSLETSITDAPNDAGYSGYPTFRNPHEYVEAIKGAGINVLVTANNHVLDQGPKGAIETMDWVERNGILYTGTFKDPAKRDSAPVLFLEKNGIKLALINYTESTNGFTAGAGMVNSLNLAQIQKDIAFAKANGADLVLVWLHLGVEYQRQPEPQKRKTVEAVARAGADIIIGSHPHVLEPMEVLEMDDGRRVFVAYSLGNFISNQYWRYSTDGMILNMEIVKTEGRAVFTNVTYIPTAVVRTYTGPEKINEPAVKASTDGDFITRGISRGFLQGPEVRFRVVAVADALAAYENKTDPTLTLQDYLRLKTTWADTTSLIGETADFKIYSGVSGTPALN